MCIHGHGQIHERCPVCAAEDVATGGPPTPPLIWMLALLAILVAALRAYLS